jgi:MoxR-like ATPase
MDVNHEKLAWLVGVYRGVGKPLFIAGATGIGKSEGVIRASKEYAKSAERVWTPWVELTMEDRRNLLDNEQVKGVHLFVDVRTALLEPTDLMGIPNLNGTYVEWRPTLLFKVLSLPDVSATVFFDEFNLGSRMVQNASYQIVLDKAIGETKLGRDVFVIAAGNRTEDMANIIETPAPLNNRFGHCTLMIPTHDEWIKYHLDSTSPDPRIVGFLKAFPDQLHTFKKNQKEKAFATPRALQELALMIHTFDELKKLEEMSDIAASKCGDAFAVKFRSFLELSRKIDLDAIIAKPELIKEYKDNEKLDIYYAIISGIAFRCKENFGKVFEPALKIANYIQDEYAIFMLRMIESIAGRAKLVSGLKKSQFWHEKLSGKLGPLLGIED